MWVCGTSCAAKASEPSRNWECGNSPRPVALAGGDRSQLQPDTVTSSSSTSPILASGNLNFLLYPWEIFIVGSVLTLNVALELLWLSRGIFFLFLLRTSPDTQAADGWT